MKTRTSIFSALFVLCFAGPSYAQDLQNTINRDLENLEQKYVGLAEAFSQENFSWRPGDGVRSVSEALMHVVAANFAIPLRFGAELPDGVPQAWLNDPDSFTDQAAVVEALKQSFRFAREVIGGTPDEDLWVQVPGARQGTTAGGQLILLQFHAHEHLGQMIAYARVNGIVPPWSR